MWNLDLQAAKTAQEIINAARTENKKQVNELQAQLNKSLGVLQESGVYALFIYLLAKRKKDKSKDGDPCQVIIEQLLNAVEKNKDELGFKNNESPPPGSNRQDSSKVLLWVQNTLVGDLHRLLLFRDFFQRVLTYARYAAEAREVELNSRESGSENHGSAPSSGGQP